MALLIALHAGAGGASMVEAELCCFVAAARADHACNPQRLWSLGRSPLRTVLHLLARAAVSPELTNDGGIMFAGIDIASERHVLARLDDTGAPVGKPMPITEDRAGYDALLKALGPLPALIAMEATGHYWKNLFAVLAAAGHDPLCQ